MTDYKEFLKQNPNGTFSTIDGSKIKSRLFQYLWNDGDKIYFCTGNKKPVFSQIKCNPNVSFCTWNPAEFENVSISGKVEFVDDMEGKKRVLELYPMIKGLYQEHTNPEFELFYVDVEEVEIFSAKEGLKQIKIK